LADISEHAITLARWLLTDSVLQSTWQCLLRNYGDIIASPSFAVVLPISFYFVACCLFMALDLSSMQWLDRYRIQPQRPPSWRAMKPALILTLWNQVLYVLPVAAVSIVFGHPIPLPSDAPTMSVLLLHIGLCMVTFDAMYFAWHWLFHKWRWGFQHVHSVHHRYSATFAWVTQYVHPVELLFTGFFSAITPVLFGCHPLTTWAWTLVNIWISIDAHCGYDFPWSLHNWLPFYGGALHHDMHHLRPRTNYEPFFTYLDWLAGTAATVPTSSCHQSTAVVPVEGPLTGSASSLAESVDTVQDRVMLASTDNTIDCQT
jgi:cholesterol 25-hydroxylase